MESPWRWLFLVLFVLVGILPRNGWGQEPPAETSAIQRHPDGRTTIQIAAQDGWISASDAWLTLSEASRLDGRAIGGEFLWGGVPLDPLPLRLSLDAWNLLCGDVLRVQVENDSQGDAQGLNLEFSRAALEQRSNQITATVRDVIAGQLGPGSLAEFHGLHWDSPLEEIEPSRQLVILTHGYNSGPASCRPLADHLTERGFACGVFCYPNDGPLAESAELLSRELHQLQKSCPDRSVVLIAHSMGGVVARASLETESPPRNVRQLILVATPNQGSTLARLPGGLDPWEHVWMRHVVRPRILVADTAGDGLNEARWDLRPGSPFLRELNARPRNAEVKYSLLLGTAGTCPPENVEQSLRGWTKLSSTLPGVGLFSPRVERFLEESRGLCAGAGDGVVSVEQGQLAGVQNVCVLPFAHHTFRDAEPSPARHALWGAIVDRLNETAAH